MSSDISTLTMTNDYENELLSAANSASERFQQYHIRFPYWGHLELLSASTEYRRKIWTALGSTQDFLKALQVSTKNGQKIRDSVKPITDSYKVVRKILKTIGKATDTEYAPKNLQSAEEAKAIQRILRQSASATEAISVINAFATTLESQIPQMVNSELASFMQCVSMVDPGFFQSLPIAELGDNFNQAVSQNARDLLAKQSAECSIFNLGRSQLQHWASDQSSSIKALRDCLQMMRPITSYGTVNPSEPVWLEKTQFLQLADYKLEIEEFQDLSDNKKTLLECGDLQNLYISVLQSEDPEICGKNLKTLFAGAEKFDSLEPHQKNIITGLGSLGNEDKPLPELIEYLRNSSHSDAIAMEE